MTARAKPSFSAMFSLHQSLFGVRGEHRQNTLKPSQTGLDPFDSMYVGVKYV